MPFIERAFDFNCLMPLAHSSPCTWWYHPLPLRCGAVGCFSPHNLKELVSSFVLSHRHANQFTNSIRKRRGGDANQHLTSSGEQNTFAGHQGDC